MFNHVEETDIRFDVFHLNTKKSLETCVTRGL